MIAPRPTVAPHSLAAYLTAAELIDSTIVTTARGSAQVEGGLVRSYAGPPSWSRAGAVSRTAVEGGQPILVGAERVEDGLVAQIVQFMNLDEGWDGENAAKPSASAALDAIRFLRAAGDRAGGLEPTIHVDGSILLEIGDGGEGSLRFKGDGSVVYAIRGSGTGRAAFDGYSIPVEVEAALPA